MAKKRKAIIDDGCCPELVDGAEFDLPLGIPIINASTSYVFDLPETPNKKAPTRRGERLMEKASRF